VAVAIALADKPQSCPQGNAHGRYTSWHGQPIDLFDETPADFASSRVACLRLSTAKNGDVAASVELTFTTQQVRDGLPAGWRARSSVRVTLAAKGQAQTMAAVSDTQPATPGVAAAGTTQAPRPVEAPAPPSGTPVPASDSTPAAPTPTADSVGESTAPDARPATEDTTNDPEVEEEVLSE
jgi:hypothetical protein